MKRFQLENHWIWLAMALLPYSQSHAIEWWQRAARLTGTSETTRRSELQAIRATPQIETRLREALNGPRRPLALDTIVALPLPSLVPDILKAAASDRTGIVFLALGALMTPENAAAILGAAEKRLLDRDSPAAPAVQVVLLDLVGRLQRIIPVARLSLFFESPSYEVRSAALNYLRTRLVGAQDRTYLPLLDKALTASPYQLRWQAAHLVRDLPEPLRETGMKKLSLCRADKREEVRASCVAFAEETP